MPRSVNAVASRQRRKKILKKTRGQFGGRRNVWTVAKNSYEKGQVYSYAGRKIKKRDYRGIWIVRINAAVRQYGMSYSEFIGKLHQNNIRLNRKTLADLAMNEPEAFKAVVKSLQ
jgi:large subunit ribosomal protein L20